MGRGHSFAPTRHTGAGIQGNVAHSCTMLFQRNGHAAHSTNFKQKLCNDSHSNSRKLAISNVTKRTNTMSALVQGQHWVYLADHQL